MSNRKTHHTLQKKLLKITRKYLLLFCAWSLFYLPDHVTWNHPRNLIYLQVCVGGPRDKRQSSLLHYLANHHLLPFWWLISVLNVGPIRFDYLNGPIRTDLRVVQRRVRTKNFEVRFSVMWLRFHDDSYLARLRIYWRWRHRIFGSGPPVSEIEFKSELDSHLNYP